MGRWRDDAAYKDPGLRNELQLTDFRTRASLALCMPFRCGVPE